MNTIPCPAPPEPKKYRLMSVGFTLARSIVGIIELSNDPATIRIVRKDDITYVSELDGNGYFILKTD
jgi:hypothetical protein